MYIDNCPDSISEVARRYSINEKTLDRYYRHHLSSFQQWEQLAHSDDYILLKENVGKSLCIDETALSDGELYTIVTNRMAHCRKGSIVAIVKGIKSDTVVSVLHKIRKKIRCEVEEITLDLSDTMANIARRAFPYAKQTIDRFHVQKLINDVVQDIRVKHRWEAQKIEDNLKIKAKGEDSEFCQVRFPNGETISQLFIRSRYALMQPRDKWKEAAKERMKVLFDHFPQVEDAYNIAQEYRWTMDMIKDVKLRELEYQKYRWKKQNNMNDEIRNSEELTEKQYFKLNIKNKLIRWYDYVEKHDTDGYFKSILRTFERKNKEILNYCENGASNAFAESFNAKIKAFRARLKGIKDTKFFLFRLAMMLG